MNLGERIKSLREEKGLTQKDLAMISGVCQQMISKLETGRAQHTGDVVPLACALDVSPLWLQGFSNDRSGANAGKKTNRKSIKQQLHHRAIQISIEFLSKDTGILFKKHSFRKQADLLCQCYDICTQTPNRSRNKTELFAILRKQIKQIK